VPVAETRNARRSGGRLSPPAVGREEPVQLDTGLLLGVGCRALLLRHRLPRGRAGLGSSTGADSNEELGAHPTAVGRVSSSSATGQRRRGARWSFTAGQRCRPGELKLCSEQHRRVSELELCREPALSAVRARALPLPGSAGQPEAREMIHGLGV
jgi:hypothetical protein